MAYGTKEALIDELCKSSEVNHTANGDTVRDILVESLTKESVDVFDSVSNYKLYGLYDVASEKRKRGRPRKESRDDVGDNGKSICHDAVLNDKKEKARKLDRMNPQPTEELQKIQDLNAELREVEWDMSDLPDRKNDAMSMIADIDNLRDEAGIERLDDSFKTYAE